jgi:hypothetical protein
MFVCFSSLSLTSPCPVFSPVSVGWEWVGALSSRALLSLARSHSPFFLCWVRKEEELVFCPPKDLARISLSSPGVPQMLVLKKREKETGKAEGVDLFPFSSTGGVG